MTQIKIGNYTYNPNEILGKGSTGTVYLGRSISNNIQVAIKVIDLKNITNQVTQYLLQNQTKALQLSNHPNVLTAYDILYDTSSCYVITNYCPNNTLQNLIKIKGKIPEDQALQIFKEIINGYLNLSINKILHRDLKPSNILFNHNHIPVICDFGYCEIVGYKKKPKLQYNVGSPAYMAPESITKNLYSESSQIWSLGTILYEMLEGKSFAYGRDVMEAIMDIKKKGHYEPKGASEFSKSLIRECMALHPNERIKLKELVEMLRTGEVRKRVNGTGLGPATNNSPVRNSIKMSGGGIRKEQEIERNVYSVPSQIHQQYHQKLDNLQQIQQQQQLILPVPIHISPQQQQQQLQNNILIRSPTQTSTFNRNSYDPRVTRSTLPMTTHTHPSYLPIQSFFHHSTQSQLPHLPQHRFSIHPSHQIQTFSRPPSQTSFTINTIQPQPQILLQPQPPLRPSTSKLPVQHVPTILTSSNPHLIPRYQQSVNTDPNRTFVTDVYLEDTQMLHNASFRSQPVVYREGHEEGIEQTNSELIEGREEGVNNVNINRRQKQRNNTIDGINREIESEVQRQGSVRSLIVGNGLGSSRRGGAVQMLNHQNIQQEQQQKQKSKMEKLIEQYNQKYPTKALHQTQPQQQQQQLQPQHQQQPVFQVPSINPVNSSKLLSQPPNSNPTRFVQQQTHHINHNPFLKPNRIQTFQTQQPQQLITEVQRSIIPQHHTQQYIPYQQQPQLRPQVHQSLIKNTSKRYPPPFLSHQQLQRPVFISQTR